MKRQKLSVAPPLAAGIILIPGVTEARAGFMGHTITAEWIYPDFDTILESHTLVVADGVELTKDDIISDDKYSIDLGDDYVLFTFNLSEIYWDDSDFNSWRFTDTNGTIAEITGYSIGKVSDGIDLLYESDLSFDTESVWGNFAGTTIAESGDYTRLKVNFIPAPSALSFWPSPA